MEDFAFILDYLAQGLADAKRFRREPLAFALGEQEFKLLELVPQPDATFTIGEKVYIGKDLDQRTLVLHVKRRVGWEELTTAAQNELPFVLEQLIKADEQRFLRFYNDSGAVSTRLHVLELLPGLGKKTMVRILDERKKRPFATLAGITERIPQIHHPEKLIAKRIEQEIADPSQKYHIFVAP